MLRILILSCLLLFISKDVHSQNLIKNASFKQQLEHWEYRAEVFDVVQNNLAFMSNHFFPFLFYTKYVSSYLKMGDNASIAQTVQTKVGEMYTVNIKLLNTQGLCMDINIYINGENVKQENICNSQIVDNYISVDFLAEESNSLITIETQQISQNSTALCITDVICTNKNTVSWEQYYKD